MFKSKLFASISEEGYSITGEPLVSSYEHFVGKKQADIVSKNLLNVKIKKPKKVKFKKSTNIPVEMPPISESKINFKKMDQVQEDAIQKANKKQKQKEKKHSSSVKAHIVQNKKQVKEAKNKTKKLKNASQKSNKEKDKKREENKKKVKERKDKSKNKVNQQKQAVAKKQKSAQENKDKSSAKQSEDITNLDKKNSFLENQLNKLKSMVYNKR